MSALERHLSGFSVEERIFKAANDKVFWIGIFCFTAIYFIFMGMLSGDAPIDLGDDLARLVYSQTQPWDVVLQSFFSLDYYHPGDDPLGQGIALHGLTNRVGQTLLLKVAYVVFRQTDALYYLFQFLFACGTFTLLAYLVYKLTGGSLVFAFASAMFYAVLPFAFVHHTWLSDPAKQAHFFILTAFTAFLKILEPRLMSGRPLPTVRLWLWSALFLVSAFMACKIKMSGLIVPLATLTYSALSLMGQGLNKKDLTRKFTFIAILAAVLAVIYFTAHAVQSGKIHPENIFKMTAMNTGNEYEGENNCALFDLSHVPPVSLARSLGFFLSWVLLGSTARLFSFRKVFFPRGALLIGIWFFWEILLYAIAKTEPRYLTDALIPLGILTAVLFRMTIKETKGILLRRLFTLFISIGFLFSLSAHLQSLLFIRNWWASYYCNLERIPAILYNDYHGRSLGRRLSYEEAFSC